MEILPLLFMQAAVLIWNTCTTKSNHIPKEAEDGNPAIVVHASSSVEMEHMYHLMQNTLRKKLKMEILSLLFMSYQSTRDTKGRCMIIKMHHWQLTVSLQAPTNCL
jgi:hypothetical protein